MIQDHSGHGASEGPMTILVKDSSAPLIHHDTSQGVFL